MKSPCVHLISCSVDSNYQCDTCEMYHADILPVLKRWQRICDEKQKRFLCVKQWFPSYYWYGKADAIKEIISHLERGEK